MANTIIPTEEKYQWDIERLRKLAEEVDKNEQKELKKHICQLPQTVN